MPTVDNLDIQISAQVTRANASLTTLINRLDRVSASLMGVNSRGMATMGAGVNKLTNSMQNFSNATKTADFSRLARNLSSIGSIDGERVKAAASGIQSFAGALGALNKIPVSDSSLKIAELAKGISQLGYKSSTNAITNIPKLATAMSQLMRELSKAPVVSRNLIDMTNALANLARTGASSGRAAKSLGSSLDRYTLSTTRATKGTFSLASALGKLYATYWLLFRAFGKIGDAINIASDLYEVQNVVDVTFGNMASKVEEFAQTSIKQFGMSELTLKQVASQFQAMGSAMSIDKGSIANAQKYLNAQTNGYVELSDSMADVSLTLTKLTADMASFYNVEQSAVAEDLQSIFTGQTKPLRQYGVDLTEVNLKQWAMTQGLNSNIDAMTQAEKTMLRYQYVLAHTGAAQNDFQRTASSWANSVRILRQQFEQLGVVVGKTFIAALKPLINALNNAMSHIIAFAQTVSNALGKIFGWKFEVGGGGVTTDLESGADYADDLAGGMSDAANSAKKLKSYLLGIDELNVIEPIENASAGTSGGGGTSGFGGGANGGEWLKQDSILKEFESEIDTLYELGEYIRDTLIGMMESIDWKSVYEKARGFGKGLAQFLNGILAFDGQGKTIFGEVGKTFANTLNSIVYAGLEFAKEFDFYQFGVNLNDGLKQFFANFDFTALAESLNLWVDGLKETIKGFLSDPEAFKNVYDGLKDFFSEIELDTIGVIVGIMTIKKLGGISFAAGALKGIGKKVGTKLGTAIMAGLSFKGIGKLLLKLFPSSLLVSTITTTMAETGASLTKVLGQLIITPISTFLKSSLTKIFSWSPHIAAFAGILGVGNEIIDAMKERFDTSDWNLGDWITNTLSTSLSGWQSELDNLKISLELWWQDTWLSNKLWDLGQWFNTNIKPWLSADKWLELFGNIKSSADTKWNEFLTWFSETGFAKWYNESVAPYFAETDWNDMFSVIQSALQFVWGNLQTWWQESALYALWTNDIKPWFEEKDWETMYSTIQTALEKVWDSLVSWWKNTAIYRWYNDNVKPWFEEKNWTFAGIKDGLEKAFNAAVDAMKSIWNTFANWLNDALTFSFEGLTLPNGQTLAAFEVSLGKLPTFYNGGYVPTSYSMFMAGENGVPELLGTVGGRTAVAGGAEITGIREAVDRASSEEVALLRQQNYLLERILAKEGVAVFDRREALSALREEATREGWSFG